MIAIQACYKNEICGTLGAMADVVRLTPVPRVGDMFIDARGDDRTMRVSLHPERGVVVLSLWAGTTCRASFQLPLGDATRLVDLIGPGEPAGTTDETDPTDLAIAYPGLAEDLHITGSIVSPGLPQAS